MTWETVIGLEVHVQLATKSKLFSGSGTEFGAAPNTQASYFDCALPGTLPVLNGEALRMAVKFGLAIGAEIGMKSVFDRKNYFYPDLPQGYQISQLYAPIVGEGAVLVEMPGGAARTVRVDLTVTAPDLSAAGADPATAAALKVLVKAQAVVRLA